MLVNYFQVKLLKYQTFFLVFDKISLKLFISLQRRFSTSIQFIIYFPFLKIKVFSLEIFPLFQKQDSLFRIISYILSLKIIFTRQKLFKKKKLNFWVYVHLINPKFEINPVKPLEVFWKDGINFY